MPSRSDSFRSGSVAASSAAHEANRHAPVLPDDTVGFGFGGSNLDPGELSSHIDRRRVLAEMKAHGPHAEQSIDRGREDMLAGVLLHVIEATGPIDRPDDC